MKRTISAGSARRSPRRLGVAEAKATLSEALREVGLGPTIIHNRGRDLAVLLDIEEYERLLADSRDRPQDGARFLERVDALKRHLGGGVERFEPPLLRLAPQDPFEPAPRRRR